MKIWKMKFDSNNYNNLVSNINVNWNELLLNESEDLWRKIELTTTEKNQALGDAPSLISSVPVFSKRAVYELNDLINNSTEIYSVANLNESYFLIKVTDIVDCIDYDRSDIKRFKSSGKIMRFREYSFVKELLYDKHIFKTTEERINYPFVSDEFVKRVQSKNLKGFKFKLVWEG